MDPLKLKTWAWSVGIVVAALLAVLAGQTLRLESERGAHQKTKASHALQVAQIERLAKQSESDARTEEQRRAAALEVVVNETEKKLNGARISLDDSRRVGQRLRNQIAAITSNCRPATSGTSSPSPGQTEDATERMLADVRRRLDEAAEGIAGFADQSHIAGRACEQIYSEIKGAN